MFPLYYLYLIAVSEHAKYLLFLPAFDLFLFEGSITVITINDIIVLSYCSFKLTYRYSTCQTISNMTNCNRLLLI